MELYLTLSTFIVKQCLDFPNLFNNMNIANTVLVSQLFSVWRPVMV